MGSKRSSSFGGRTFIGTAALIIVTSCSLVLGKETAQCQTTADCVGRGPEFQFYTCTPDNVCAAPADFCTSNQQCVEANGGRPFLCNDETLKLGGAATHKCVEGCETSIQCEQSDKGKALNSLYICDQTKHACVEGCETTAQCIAGNGGHPYLCDQTTKKCVVGCETNAQCIDDNGGKAYTCRKDIHQCVPLLLDDKDVCPQILISKPEDLRNDDVYFVGLVVSQAGATPSIGPGVIEGAELARREIVRAGGGSLPMGTKRRPIVFVNCDNNVNADLALNHLIKTVHVQAMIGPTNSGIFGTNGPTQIVPANVIAVTGAGGGAPSSVLTGSHGLLWRTQPGDPEYTKAIPKYVSDYFEPQVRAQLGIPANGTIKIAVVNQSDSFGVATANYLSANLIFNGKTAVDNGSNYKNINYGNPTTDPDTSAKQAQAAQDLIAFQPHLIFYTSRTEGMNGIIKPVETGWTASYRPVHMLNTALFSGALSTFLTNFSSDITVRNELRRRVIGVSPTSKNLQQEALYKIRHHAEWDGFVHAALPPVPPSTTPPVSVGPTTYSEGTYDATYTLLSAIVATQKEDPTGPEISAAIQKTQPAAGVSVQDIGPANVGAFMNLLAAGGSVDLNGVLSDINFIDNSVKTNAALWCVPEGSTPGQMLPPVVTDLVFNPTDGTFTGTPPVNNVFTSKCP